MGYKEERKPWSLFLYPRYCSKSSELQIQCFSESPYVCKCQKTDALTVPAFPLVILKDYSNTLPGELG